MHAEVGVNEDVSHARNLSPGDASMLSLEWSGNEFDGLADDHEVPDHPALHNHAMMVGIQSAIDIATDCRRAAAEACKLPGNV